MTRRRLALLASVGLLAYALFLVLFRRLPGREYSLVNEGIVKVAGHKGAIGRLKMDCRTCHGGGLAVGLPARPRARTFAMYEVLVSLER